MTEEIKNNKTEKPEGAGAENAPEADLDEFIEKIKERIAEHAEEHKILTKTGIGGLADSYEPSKEDAEKAIKERAAGLDKFKIFVREKFFSGKNGEKKDQTYIELAGKYIEKEIQALEQDGGLVKSKKIEEEQKEEIIGKEIKKRGTDLEKNKKTSEANLAAVQGLGKISPEKIAKWQEDFKNEQAKLEELIQEKKEEQVEFNETKGQEAEEIADKLGLKERIEKFAEPAKNKVEKLNDLIKEYEECHSLVYDEKKKYKTQVSGCEKALRGLKGEDFPTTEMRAEVTELLKEAQENEKKLEDTQALLKSRLDKMRDEKKKNEALLERLNKVGKTGKELEAEKKEKRRKQEEEKKKKEEAEKANAEKPNKNETEEERIERLTKLWKGGAGTADPESEEDGDSDDIEDLIKKAEKEAALEEEGKKKPEATAEKKEEAEKPAGQPETATINPQENIPEAGVEAGGEKKWSINNWSQKFIKKEVFKGLPEQKKLIKNIKEVYFPKIIGTRESATREEAREVLQIFLIEKRGLSLEDAKSQAEKWINKIAQKPKDKKISEENI